MGKGYVPYAIEKLPYFTIINMTSPARSKALDNNILPTSLYEEGVRISYQRNSTIYKPLFYNLSHVHRRYKSTRELILKKLYILMSSEKKNKSLKYIL